MSDILSQIQAQSAGLSSVDDLRKQAIEQHGIEMGAFTGAMNAYRQGRQQIAQFGNLIKTDNPQINLPFVSGNVDIKDFLQFKTIIDNSSLDFNNIKSLNYLKSRRWDLETKDGLIIQLPLKEIEFALDILNKILKKEEFKKIKVIDLRQNNQVIINE